MKKIFGFIFLMLIHACDDSENTYYEIQENKIIYHYVKRLGQNFYTATYYTKDLKNVDLVSFKIIDQYYAKDDYKIYFEGKELKNRDIATFKLLKHNISVDKKSAYFKNRRIEELKEVMV